MFAIIAKSIGVGILIGFAYGFLFVLRLKRLYKKGVKGSTEFAEDKKELKLIRKKAIFNFSFFSILGHILLILVFVFLILKVDNHLPALLISFILSFWLSILFFSKPSKEKENISENKQENMNEPKESSYVKTTENKEEKIKEFNEKDAYEPKEEDKEIEEKEEESKKEIKDEEELESSDAKAMADKEIKKEHKKE